MELSFGEKIKEARKTKKLTQKQLATSIGAKHNSVSDWENNKNKPDPDTIELLCGVLDITPNYLLASSVPTKNIYSPIEYQIILKYRILDEHGKDMVDTVLSKEYVRTLEQTKQRVEHQKERQPQPPLLQAVHARTDIEQTPEGIAHNLALMGSNMKCLTCKNGDMVESTTTFFSDLNTCLLIIKNVPCNKCTQCGEEYLNGVTILKIEEILKNIKSFSSEIAIVDFNNATSQCDCHVSDKGSPLQL